MDVIGGPSLLRPYELCGIRGDPRRLGVIGSPAVRRRARRGPRTRHQTTNTDRRSQTLQERHVRRSAGDFSRLGRTRARRLEALRRPASNPAATCSARSASGSPPRRTTDRLATTDACRFPESGTSPHASRCSWRSPRWCRWSPTASSRSSRCSAAPATSVIAGNENVATRAAEEIRRYVTTNAEILKALAADLQDTGLTRAQQDRILKNYVLQFREFRELTLFDEAARADRHEPRRQAARLQIPKDAPLTVERRGDVADPRRRRPAADVASSRSISRSSTSRPAGSSANSASKKCGGWSTRSASASTATRWSSRPNGELIAHGDPDKKALVAQPRNMSGHPLVAAARRPMQPVGAGIHRRRRPARTRRRRPHRAARLDRDRRAADERGLRHRHAAAAAARRRRSRPRCS